MQQLMLFDYTALGVEARVVVQQRTGEIKTLMRRAAQDIVDIGLKLIEIKDRLPHGAFLPWLRAEFEWSDDTARRFMQVAERFGHKPQLVRFAPSALYLLAAPPTPEEARVEALERAGAGEEITHATAKGIVAEYAPEEEEGEEEEGRPDVLELAHREHEAAERGDYEQAIHDREERLQISESPPVTAGTAEPPSAARPRLPPPPPRFPHSDRITRWLQTVASEKLIIDVDHGGLATLLAEPGQWDARETREYILPMLQALGESITSYERDIADAFK